MGVSGACLPAAEKPPSCREPPCPGTRLPGMQAQPWDSAVTVFWPHQRPPLASASQQGSRVQGKGNGRVSWGRSLGPAALGDNWEVCQPPSPRPVPRPSESAPLGCPGNRTC